MPKSYRGAKKRSPFRGSKNKTMKRPYRGGRPGQKRSYRGSKCTGISEMAAAIMNSGSGDPRVIDFVSKLFKVSECKREILLRDLHENYNEEMLIKAIDALYKMISYQSQTESNKTNNYDIMQVKGDGTCLFRAFRVSLSVANRDQGIVSLNDQEVLYLHNIAFNMDEEIQTLRNQVADKVLELWNKVLMDGIRISTLVEWDHGHTVVENYREFMRKRETFAAEAEIIALSEIFKRNIVVHDAGRTHISKLPESTFTDSVHIWFDGFDHYKAMVRNSALDRPPTHTEG